MKHLTIIAISFNFLLISPHLSLSNFVNALMSPAPRGSKFWVRFSASSFFSLSYRMSTLSRLSLSSLACFSIASSPFPGIPGLVCGSLSSFFWSAKCNSVLKCSFTVTAVRIYSNQILPCQGGSDFDDTYNIVSPISWDCLVLRILLTMFKPEELADV